MKNIIRTFTHRQKILLILGLLVSFLTLLQNDMYSHAGMENYLPDLTQVKEKITNRVMSDQDHGTNLTNGNFIASYIHVIANRPEKTEEEKCTKATAISTIKQKVASIFSAL